MNRRDDKLLEGVLHCAQTRVPQAQRAAFATFVSAYFGQVDPDALAEFSAEALFEAAWSHWQWGAVRAPGQPKMRVYNPAENAPGLRARHAIIEVINDDMPFLVDSTVMEVNRQGLTLYLIVHPVLYVARDAQGQLLEVHSHTDVPDAAQRESWMRIEVDRCIDEAQCQALTQGFEDVLKDVRAAVHDWPSMQDKLKTAIESLDSLPQEVPKTESSETRAFLQWLLNDRFVLLGYRQHRLVHDQGADALALVIGSGLGVLREQSDALRSDQMTPLPAKARGLARALSPIVIVSKANTRSRVHRPGYADYVGVKQFDARGQVVGEHRFLGLFTSTAYSARVHEVPLLRGKVAAVMQRAAASGVRAGGHLSKALAHILETYPRDELFQMTEDDLYAHAVGILQLGERQRLRLFVRRDPFDRFVSCLIFVPREAYSTDLRRRFVHILMHAFEGASADFDVLLTDSVLARIHITVRSHEGHIPDYNRKTIEQALAQAARRWDEALRDALIASEGQVQGLALHKRWAEAFPIDYRERYEVVVACEDARKLQALSAHNPLALCFYRPQANSTDNACALPDARVQKLGFKVYHWGAPMVLSDSLPMLERMGVRVLAEHSFCIGGGETSLWLHDFELEAALVSGVPFDTIARLFEDCFYRVRTGDIENDEFNRLPLCAGLAAQQVVVLRAYAKYLKQIGFALSQSTIETALATHPHIAHSLIDLFNARFDPSSHDPEKAAAHVSAIERALDQVQVLSEDRALRQLLALIQATVRTNFWRTGIGHSGAQGPRRSFLSFKFDSAHIPELPDPKPVYEIFVYAPQFEGIHLRGGKVARGGLRWSDRPEDFRTEVLGLLKAQMVKNIVIVPVGSKGGFVLKGMLPTERSALQAVAIARYQDYLRGLLDLTDNRVGDHVVPPPQVVRHDEDDPYLVVAADKGTASFSDHANAVSAEYGHWLGDAFASGGSAGYDHKAMGITARGAWESAKRHFRQMGVNTQTTEFTVVGIGDMSGDVFGNGMLLSEHIRLLAAFDHRHIFIDPNPDAARSFVERSRLFKLPRSSWADYDRGSISEGGGVWARSEKSIPISPQVQAVLGIQAARLAPHALISALLKAPVDLLYNGGIGTYIKAREETHAQVGDRANDAVRIDGCEIRAKVVVEGGNLGCTQRGRIEAALNGVRIHTDAIDNSAGVDASDHEVNIKILLGLALAQGRITPSERNQLLAEMTEDVATLVLRDNIFQTQILSMAGRVGHVLLDQQTRLIRFLEKSGRLNRALECLPAEDELAERKTKQMGLTLPEHAVLLAYSKMWVYDELLASDLPDDPWVRTALVRYFPQRLHAPYADLIPLHPLRREIIATHVMNSMLNRVGATFVHRLMALTGARPAHIVRAYLLMREVLGMVSIWGAVEALNDAVPYAVQTDMLIALARLGQRVTAWFARSPYLDEPMHATIERFSAGVDALRKRLAPQASALAPVSVWTQAGVPYALAERVALTVQLAPALDIVAITQSAAQPMTHVADVYDHMAQLLKLDPVRAHIDALPNEGYWDSLSKNALRDDLASVQRAMAQQVLQQPGADADAQCQAWLNHSGPVLERAQRVLTELAEAPSADLAMLSVALRALRQLV